MTRRGSNEHELSRSALRGSGLPLGTVSSSALAATAASLPVFFVGALAVQLRPSLHLSLGSLGLVVSIYYVAASIGSVPAGRLAERLGAARTMRAAALAATLALALVALFADSWATLAAFLVVAGLANAAMQPAANLLLVRRIPRDRQGLAFGLKQSSVPFATLLGGLAVPGLALTIGWRWAFGFGAALGVLAAVLAPLSRRTPESRRRQRQGPWPSGTMPPLVVLAVGFGLGVFATTGLTTFLVTSAVAAGMGHGSAGLVAALAGGASVAVRVGIGIITDRRSRSPLPIVVAMLLVGVPGYLGLAVGAATGQLALFVAGAALAFGAGWGWNGLFNFAIASSHPDAPARASGITLTGGRLAGVAGPIVFGVVVSQSSYVVAWGVSAAVALMSAFVVLWGLRLLTVSAARRGRPEPVPVGSASEAR